MIEKTKISIAGLRELIKDRHGSLEDIEKSMSEKLNSLDLLADDGDLEALESARLIRDLLREIKAEQKKLTKINIQKDLYEDVLLKSHSRIDREVLIKRI